MTEFLDSIDYAVLGLYLVICYAHLFTSQKASSLVIAVIGLTFCELISHLFKPVRDLVSYEVAKHIWYLGYMLIHILTIAVMVRLCKILEGKITFGLELKLTFIAQLLLFCIQGARYLDRVIFESNILASFYMAAIPSINIVVIGVIVITSIVAVFKGWKGKKELKVD